MSTCVIQNLSYKIMKLISINKSILLCKDKIQLVINSIIYKLHFYVQFKSFLAAYLIRNMRLIISLEIFYVYHLRCYLRLTN